MDFKKILFKTDVIDVEKVLPDAVVFCDKSGKIHWVNDKAVEVFETTKTNLMTSNIKNFIENALNIITNAVIYDKPMITKLLAGEVYFDMTVKSIDEGFVLSFRQSNNCKENNVEIRHTTPNLSSSSKDLFISKLANDFKSPLQSIVGFSQAMAVGLGGDMTEQQEKYIKIIKKNSTDLMYFTDKLVEMSRTEADTQNPDYKTFDLISLLNSVIKFNEQLNKDKDIKLILNVEEGFKNAVISDENYVKNIIQNILEVILRSVDRGEITINICTPNEELLQSKGLAQINYFMINIVSNSLLLSESDLDSIFDPYKIIDSLNRKNLLRSMTLYCVMNMVQALRGIMWVESKILKNTSFSILIPNGQR